MVEAKSDSNKEIAILIAEDSPTQADLLKHYLAMRGYSVTVAKGGKEALAAALQAKPAAVITDVVMPEMDGYTLCKEIKSQPTLKDVPVILLTSLARPQDVLKGLECGADSFIRKPYDENYLFSRLEYILTNQELRKTERIHVGLQLYFGGRTYFITAEKQQILDLLISTYEGAIRLNEDLEHNQQKLEAANKELEAFSYTVAHDLRAPLRHINSFASILEQGYADKLDDDGRQYLRMLADGAQKMGALVDDLLNLSRISRQELSRTLADLGELVRNVINDLKPDYAKRMIKWTIGPLPQVECDAGLMKQVFTNLLSNAVKYTLPREEAIIEVGESSHNNERIIFVRDNGVGFDMKYADKLFGAFQRLHSAEEFAGTGVGLATVQRIIHKHGGRASAHAEPGKGATFFFSLEGL